MLSISQIFLHIYSIQRCLRVPEEQAPLDGVDVQEDLTYTEHPVKILETSERVTRNKRIKMCRVQWSHHSEAEATWEREDELMKTYPDLFASQPEFDCGREIAALGRSSASSMWIWER